MGLFDFLRPRANPSARATESTTAFDFRRDGDGYQGRRIHGQPDDPDLLAQERYRAIQRSRQLYRQSPAYGAVVDRYAQHVIGDGVVIQVSDQAAQDWLNKQLARPENDWENLIAQRIRLLMVDGELLWTISGPARPDGTPSSNFVLGRWGLEGIRGIRTHPFNHSAVREILYAPPRGPGEERWYQMAEPGTFPEAHAIQTEEGEAVVLVAPQFWRANTLGVRSGPLFTRILDKADSMDVTLEEFVRKVEYLNRFWLHVTYKKANDEALGEHSKDVAFEEEVNKWATQMEPGACLTTGEDVKVTAVAPDIKAQDMGAVYDTLLDWILGSEGIPRHWFSSGGDTNRATAAEQGSPIYRSVSNFQSKVAADINGLVRYLLWWGEMAGMPWKASEVESVVIMSDVANRDSIRDAQEVMTVTTAMNEAEMAGGITSEEKADIIRGVVASKHYGDQLKEQADSDAAKAEEEAEPTPEEDPTDGDETVRESLPVHRLRVPDGV